jgi:RNA polymerase sigma-70 factor (ECF subfamily)
MSPEPQEHQGVRPPLDGANSDHHLLLRARDGDQDAATELYFRYAKRLNILVERQCSQELARSAGVEDIVQSVFRSFFRRVRQGFYDAPAGEELWRLLLVIALHKIRDKASYHHAAKRDAQRTIGGEEGRLSLESQPDDRESSDAEFEMVLNEMLEILPPDTRVIVKLRIDGCQVAEVAKAVGRSRRSVERVLHETRLRLCELLPKGD